MKTHKFLSFLLIFIFLVIPTLSVTGAVDGWQPVADGIDYQKFHLTSPRPIDIFVARLDRSNPNTTIDTGLGQGKIISGRETVKDMAARYDQTINYWGQTWGNRNQVVVAINGYYFDGTTGTPWSGVGQSGWYAKRFTETVGDAGFGWSLNRDAYIGECVYHSAGKQFITFNGYTPNISDINVPYDGNQKTILYTPQYDSGTDTVNSQSDPVLEIVIELTRPTLILPQPKSVEGTIRSINDKQGSALIPFDHVVFSVWGDVRTTLLDKIAIGDINVGDKVGITQEISNCVSSPVIDWTKTYATLGGDYHFLRDNTPRTVFSNPDASVPNSRTAVAYNSQYVFYIVVDGFNLGVSEGIKISELVSFVQGTLGGTDAVSLDSGTSSTMVINGQIVNNTYCTYTRNCGMKPKESSGTANAGQFLSLYQTDTGDTSKLPGDKPTIVNAPEVDEARVGTGMFMIVSQPLIQSSSYSPGDNFLFTNTADLLLGPGTNYTSVLSVPAGATGTVVGHANGLNGVYAKGQYWWPVNYNGVIGWTSGTPSAAQNERVFLAFIGQYAVSASKTIGAGDSGNYTPNPLLPIPQLP